MSDDDEINARAVKLFVETARNASCVVLAPLLAKHIDKCVAETVRLRDLGAPKDVWMRRAKVIGRHVRSLEDAWDRGDALLVAAHIGIDPTELGEL